MVSNKLFYSIIFIFIFLFVSVLAFGSYATLPDPGHGADTIMVSINGEEMTLQSAIDNQKIGRAPEEVDIKSYLYDNCKLCVSYSDNNGHRTAPGSWNCKSFGSDGSQSLHLPFEGDVDGNDDAWFKIQCT